MTTATVAASQLGYFFIALAALIAITYIGVALLNRHDRKQDEIAEHKQSALYAEQEEANGN